MTHENQNANLLESVKGTLTAARNGMPNLPKLRILLQDMRDNLESQPFDVLQHLRNGGEVRTTGGSRFKFMGFNNNTPILRYVNAQRHWVGCEKSQFIVFMENVLQNTIHAHNEPPAEGTREWAMVQDCPVRNEHWTNTSYVQQIDGVWRNQDDEDFDDLMYDDALWRGGWSLYMEPWEPGIMDAFAVLKALRGDGWCVAVHNDYKLNGKDFTFWLFTKDDKHIKGEGATDMIALSNAYNQIGSTRIELETPEDELEDIKIGGTISD